MESPAKRSSFQAGTRPVPPARARRSHSGREGGERDEAPVKRLEVEDVVQRGTGRGSRLDLTVIVAGGTARVRLIGIPAKQVLSYGSIEKRAMEQGVVLPFYRCAGEVWRAALSEAMERVRREPSLEGEEIADAIAAEIRALLESTGIGGKASELASGKVMKREDRVFASAKMLVQTVRARLVDDVLPRETVAEAAAVHLGKREARLRLDGMRLRLWSFPWPLPVSTDCELAPPSIGSGAATRALAFADGAKLFSDGPDGPVHGPEDPSRICRADSELRAGSSGPLENAIPRPVQSSPSRSAGDVGATSHERLSDVSVLNETNESDSER